MKHGRPAHRFEPSLGYQTAPNFTSPAPEHNCFNETADQRDDNGYKHGRYFRPIEHLGYPRFSEWEERHYIEWGHDFMWANGGREVTEDGILALRPKDVAPALSSVLSIFPSLENYRQKVQPYYEEREAERQQLRSERLDAIERALANGQLPQELFHGVSSEEEMIKRYARYMVTSSVYEELQSVYEFKVSEERKLKIVNSINDRNFLSVVHKTTYTMDRSNGHNHYLISAGEIELRTQLMGLFDVIYPRKVLVMLKLD